MPLLNEVLELPPHAAATFVGGRARKVVLAGDRELYKFSSFPMQSAKGVITPWWASVEPLDVGDPGLSGLLERSGRASVDPKDFARARSAVSNDWNDLENLIRAVLTQSVWCWIGECAHQRMDNTRPDMGNVVYIGGAWQIYLPNLTVNHIRVA